MASAAERLRHAFLRARQDVAAGAHSAPHDNGLSRELIVHGDEGVMGGERTGGTLAVNQQGLKIAVHDVLLNLGVFRNTVGHGSGKREKKEGMGWGGAEQIGPPYAAGTCRARCVCTLQQDRPKMSSSRNKVSAGQSADGAEIYTSFSTLETTGGNR